MASIGTVLQKRHSFYQKFDLAKMAPKINNGISQLITVGFLNTRLIELTPTIRHSRVIGISLYSGKNQTLKSDDHELESYNKLKKFLLKITQLSRPWQINFGNFFALHKVWRFYKAPFFMDATFVCFRGVFVMYHFCKVPLFSNGIKGCHFFYVYLMVVKL